MSLLRDPGLRRRLGRGLDRPALLLAADALGIVVVLVTSGLLLLDGAGVVDLPSLARRAANAALLIAIAGLLVHGFLVLVAAAADEREARDGVRRRISRALDVSAALIGAAFVASLLLRLADRVGIPVSPPDMVDWQRALGFLALTWAGVRVTTVGSAAPLPPVRDYAEEPPDEAVHNARSRSALAFLAISAFSAAGLLGLALVFSASRDGREPDSRLFWLGLLVVVVPAFARALLGGTSRDERLGLVIQVVLSLYVVKVMHDPLLAYSDEWVHRFNADTVLRSGELFRDNWVLGVTSSYPGLPAVVGSLASVTGLSTSVCGMIVIGLAKVLFGVSLFLVLERCVGSARGASIATILYSGAPNFIFWSSQLAYESLALPVVIAVLAIAARILDEEDAGGRLALAGFAAAGIGVVTVTHHLSSFALAFLLVAIAVATRGGDRARGFRTLVILGAGAIVAAGSWTAIVASQAVVYLRYIFTSAVESAASVVTRQGEQRGLFQGGSDAGPGLIERGVALGGVALLLALALIGLRPAWRRRRDAFVLILVIAGLDFFGSLGLRFAPGAWETSNRASSLLFLGAVMLAALGAVELGNRFGRPATVALVPVFAAILASGVIAGWPPDLRLPKASEIAVGDVRLMSPPFLVARWARAVLPGSPGVLTDEANGRVLMTVGRERVYSGRRPYVKEMMEAPYLADWMVDRIERLEMRYVVVDRREITDDNMRGYYFPRPGEAVPVRPLPTTEKWEMEGADRVVDAGPVVMYDVLDLLP